MNDGSTDGTEDIAKSFKEVKRLWSEGRGPAAARNTGLKAARGDLVWFMDSDCEAEPDALAFLLEPMDDPQVAGVGGSFGNPVESSLLACLVHEEIVQRHLGMPPRVNYLASGNVLYRRDVLERLGGFEEALIKAEDTELSYRIKSSDRQLAFARKSIVKHHHHTAMGRYLKTQYGNAYWRVFLYVNYPAQMGGDSYSGLTDHVQPPLAMLTLALIFASFFLPVLWWGVIGSILLLAAAQLPVTIKLVRRLGLKYWAFVPMGFVRAYARGLGMTAGVFRAAADRLGVTKKKVLG